MDIDEAMKAEAAARAKGGVVLGGGPDAPLAPPTPEQLMTLAAGEIVELREQGQQAHAMASTLANLIAALMQTLAEASDSVPADGEIVVKIAAEDSARAEGARLRIVPQDDSSFIIAVVLPENFETYEAAHKEDATDEV